MDPRVIAYFQDPTNIECARAYFAHDLRSDPALKLFHVTLDGPVGVKFDAIVIGLDEDDVIAGAMEAMANLRDNDFDRKAIEIEWK